MLVFQKGVYTKLLVAWRIATRQTRILDVEVCQRAAVRNLLFVGWLHLELFAVLSRKRRRCYVSVKPSWQELKAHRMLCVPAQPTFVYYLGSFGNGGQ